MGISLGVILIGQHEDDQFSYCCLLIICENCQYIFCFSLFYYIVIALLRFIAVSVVWSFSVACCQWQHWQELCSPELLIYVGSLFIEKSARLFVFSIFTFLNFPVDIVHNYVRILLAVCPTYFSRKFETVLVLWWQIPVTAGWLLWMNNYRVQLLVLLGHLID